ncbi:d66f501f-e954-4411-9454-5d1560ff0825 [Sclerotinia trifoliorum]|uniref:D66f501f-e954-4411-9454-5d1560ff0825 n=1 Tax=Sclerotinia trifoliorum TaxID=28548 RepID=A0A8H2ZPU1_9HELO|nr:d66f501f-e954-4411-9454-5d1560ff0825 [Sclerotinia trifoliorum]
MFASAGLRKDDLSISLKLFEVIITLWIEAFYLYLIISTYAILRACVRAPVSEILHREIGDPRQHCTRISINYLGCTNFC